MAASLVNDKQFYIVLCIGAAVCTVGGYAVYRTVKAVSNTIESATDYVKNDAAKDAANVAEDAATFAVGAPTASYLKEAAGYLGEFWDWTGLGDVPDWFDAQYRQKASSMSDEEYQRWKTAVQKGEIENQFKGK